MTRELDDIGFRLAQKEDLDAVVDFVAAAGRQEGGLEMPDEKRAEFLSCLITGFTNGFVCIACEGERVVGTLAVERQKNMWTGEWVYFFSTLATAPKVPVKTAHCLIFLAGCMAAKEGIAKVMLATSEANPHPAFAALGARPAMTVWEADVAEGIERIVRRLGVKQEV